MNIGDQISRISLEGSGIGLEGGIDLAHIGYLARLGREVVAQKASK